MSQTVQSLSPAAFKAVIADKSVQLVDVRTAQEYAQGTIEHALLMDVSSVDFEHEIEKLDSSSPVAVFCHSGVRSLYAATVLAERGFPAIYNLTGGIINWQ